MLRPAPQPGDEFIEQGDGVIGVPQPRGPGRQGFPGELVDHVEKPDLPALGGDVALIVQRPHLIRPGDPLTLIRADPTRRFFRVRDGRFKPSAGPQPAGPFLFTTSGSC
jgi:hypothetical protein